MQRPRPHELRTAPSVESTADAAHLRLPRRIEKQHIEKVLKIFKGNRKKSAEALNISEKGLYLKIKEYGIVVG